jgi:hypothetical protein
MMSEANYHFILYRVIDLSSIKRILITIELCQLEDCLALTILSLLIPVYEGLMSMINCYFCKQDFVLCVFVCNIE